MARRNRATVTFSLRPDGIVRAEVRTKVPLGLIETRQGRMSPAEFLPLITSFWFIPSGPRGEPRRYVQVMAQADEMLIDRHLDLSEGSDERAMVEALAKQPEIPVVWVNEGVETVYRQPEACEAAWREVIESTRGISSEEWREEIEELLWQESESWRPGPRPRGHRRRSATPPPGVALPFFATRSGAIPRTGAPDLAGEKLPQGSRQPARSAAYWASDDTVENAATLAPWFASVFSDTGLWPLLWRFPEDPENYMCGGGLIDRIDEINLDAVRGEHLPWDAVAPGPSQHGIAAGQVPASPFPDWSFDEPSRLLLVPCNRPADAVTALGGVAGKTDPPVVSAVLRRWEVRHGAVLYEVIPSLIRLSVARPPHDDEEALQTASEIRTVMSEDDRRTVEELAAELMERNPGGGAIPRGAGLNRDNWNIAV